MAVALYMDHHIPKAITAGLQARGVDVLTTQADGTRKLPDADLLDRATELEHVLFTFDDDLLTEATKRQRLNRNFNGVIYIHLQDVRIGKCIEDLEVLAKAGTPEDFKNLVTFLPL